MNLQQLYYFKSIAELEHYTKASQMLNITQSSLSHSINDLEKELGVLLFIRQGRNVRLTKCGAFFLEYVSHSLNILEEGKERLQDFISADTGMITLSYLSSLSRFVPFLISRFFGNTGKIQTRFQFDQATTQNIEEHLIAGSTDLAFTTPFDNEEIASVKIGSHRTVLMVCGDHPLAAHNEIDLTELKEERFITYDPSCQIRSYINDIFHEVGIWPEISFEAKHDSIVLGAVAANLGVALMPESADASGYNIKALPITNQIPAREIHIAWVKDRYMTPAVKNFRDFVLECGLLLDEFLPGFLSKET